MAQPAFHKPIAGYADTMVAHARRTADRWQDGVEVDIAAEMSRLTLTIAGETLLGADVEADAGGVREALTAVLDAFPIMMSPFAPLLERLPLPTVLRSRRAQAALDKVIYRIIQERRARADDRGDLLSMLLLARDEDADGGRMSDTQVRDEAMTMFLAGHETTANALTWCWYLLSRHPEVEARLQREVDAALGDRPAAADDAAGLPYTRMVLAETMRLYPPAWAIGRRAIADVGIGGHLIEKGDVLVLHTPAPDPRYPEPDRFARIAGPDRQQAPPVRTSVRRRHPGHHRRAVRVDGSILVLATLARQWRLSARDRPVRTQARDHAAARGRIGCGRSVV